MEKEITKMSIDLDNTGVKQVRLRTTVERQAEALDFYDVLIPKLQQLDKAVKENEMRS